MPERRLVVGAAILRNGRLLAARRTSPPSAAGRWEFPGGKVEEGESPEAALVREIAEELGCGIEVTGWLPGTVPIGDRYELAVATGRLVSGDPVPSEHDRIEWLGAGALFDVDWLEPDLPFLDLLRQRLASPVRGVFFDHAAADAAGERLRRDGYDAQLARERFAGEDDDEDHAWAVVTDAPVAVLERLVEEYQGWLDGGGSRGSMRPHVDERGTPPLELPTSPRRHHRTRGD